MPKTRLFTLLAILLVTLGIATTALAAANVAAPAPDPFAAAANPRSEIGNGLIAAIPSDRLVVRLYYTSQENLDAVAGSLDIWTVHPKEQYALVSVSDEEYKKLESLGYRMEVDAGKTALYGINAVLDPRYYYFDNYVTNTNGLYIKNFLQEVNAAYPDLTDLVDVGNAWQAGHGGYIRDIWVLRITNEDPAYGAISDKPAFFLYANTHAREVATPELAIRYIKYLTDGFNGEGGYTLDPDVTWLVNHNVIYVMVTQNPDGRIPDEQNGSAANRRKNMDNDDGCSLSSSWGVDLNRNHSFLWGCCGGSSGAACDETYRGPGAGSEPEVQAFQNYFSLVMKDQNGPNDDYTVAATSPITATGIFVSLHSFSDLVLWPWELDGYPTPPVYAQLTTIGRKFAYYNGYDPSGSIWYTVDGSTDIWTYGKFGLAAFTIEVGPDDGSACSNFFPAYDCIDGINGASQNFWAENKPVFIYSHKIAATPYKTTYGPDAANVSVAPSGVTPGEIVQLTAALADQRLSGDTLKPINAAEYFIDAPGVDGAGIPMLPADGAWGGTSEAVVASVDTTGLSQGQHYILVHGHTNTGDWGPFTAVFLYIVEPGVAPAIEGYVRDAMTNAPLAATVSAAGFHAETDPATGYYSMLVISGTYTLDASAAGHTDLNGGSVTVSNYETVRRDFNLMPVCTYFSDDIEAGAGGWTTGASTGDPVWGIVSNNSHSPFHSWTESPAGNYPNGDDSWLISPAFDLTGYNGVTLSFWHTYATESGFDYGYVEFSTNGGTSWSSAVASYSGSSGGWKQVSIPLAGLNNRPNAKIRFRFHSDSSNAGGGWNIDDIVLTGDAYSCNTPFAPTADFSQSADPLQGEPVQFNDLTVGTTPLTYHWDFGDGLGISTDSNPAYTFAGSGVFTVTLTVTNTIGSDAVSHPITIASSAPVSITEITLTQATSGNIHPGQVVSYTADLSPNWATKPYTYTLSFGDGSSPITATSTADPLAFTHTFTVTGTFELSIAAWNLAMTEPVTDTLATQVVSYTHGVIVAPAADGATGLPGEAIQYTLTVTNTGELADTFDIAASGNQWPVQLSAETLGPLDAGDAASLVITVTVPANAAGGEQDTLTVTVTAQRPNVEPAEAILTSTAAAVYGVSAGTDTDTLTGMHGQLITYTVLLTNTGNVTDTFDVTATSNWEVVISTPQGTLTPGEGITLSRGGSVVLTVVIAIPADAANGASEPAEIAITSRGDPEQSGQVTLTTHAVWISLYLPVVQR